LNINEPHLSLEVALDHLPPVNLFIVMTTCSAWATIGALLNRLWLIKGANLMDRAQCWVTQTT